MERDEPKEIDDFRRGVRQWFDAHCRRAPSGPPIHMFRASTTDEVAEARVLQTQLAESGLAGLTWPREYGGQGRPIVDQIVFDEEAIQFDTPTTIFALGLALAGPTIIAHGTPEQKQRFLAPMLRGDEIWCQLFSEPGAGSDLSSVRTRAVLDGDDWVVNGQKVWTSNAHHADWGILLARTDPSRPKHKGITYFVIDMHSAGVDVRPLREMTGDAHFNEVFFDDVRIPRGNVLGEINGGWAVAKTTLLNERMMFAPFQITPESILAAAESSKVYGAASLQQPVVRQELGRVLSRAQIAGWLHGRLMEALTHGRAPGPEGSVSKLLITSLIRDIANLAARLDGPAAMVSDGEEPNDWQKVLLIAPAFRILGGTDEIQRNIIAESVLGLPREPDTSRGLPFSELISAGATKPG